MESFLRVLKRILPAPMVHALRQVYHPTLAVASALRASFPARTMTVIGINGTKGKSTTADMLFSVLIEAGYKTALASTIRFAIDDTSEPNRFKMTMPGRGYLQHFLARAKRAGATHAVVELTTEGAREWRHRFLSLNALIMLNVQREHIESFGSFEKYVEAKWNIVRELTRSQKRPRTIIVGTDDEHNARFLEAPVEKRISFSLANAHIISKTERATTFIFQNVSYTLPLPGEFNVKNALAVIEAAQALGIETRHIVNGLAHLTVVRGRVEPIEAGQPFSVIVDYAHTPDSLEALYSAYPEKRKVCVLGNTGGGRDTWKRPLMGAIADRECDVVILTNEDPYDEDPEKIITDMTTDMKKKPTIIMDRREAIRHALTQARTGDVVLISGKGTDPYIMEAGGKKTPWDDATVAREELAKLSLNH